MAELDRLEIQIETSAKQASSQLDLVMEKLEKISNSLNGLNTSKLANLGKSFDVVSKSTDTASKSVGNVSSRLQSMNGVMNKSVKSTRSLASLFGSFYANCFLLIRGIKKLGTAVESSMDYIETYNYFNVITDKIGAEFGNAWKENGYSNAEDYADSFRERLNSLTSQMTGYTIGAEGGLYLSDNVGLGLDPEKIMAYQANISSITNAVGLMGETSVNTSKALTMLAADLSSLKNQDLENVMKNLQSGLIGQSRALYKYGIDITNNTLQTYAYANGIDKAVQEMTQAEKMQLRLLAILDQSKVAYGDMANTISGVANQFRIFKQQMSNLARTIGNLFIPVLQTVLPYINGFVIALQRLFVWVGNLLGVKWDNLMDGISSGYTDTGLEELSENADDVTNALEDANKAANKLKKTIHSYDELHVASDNSGNSTGDTTIGGTGGIDLSGAIADALADYEKVWNEALAGMENKAQEIADKIAGFFENMWKAIEPFRDAVKRLWDEGLSKLGNFSWTALKDFYNEFLKPMGKWAFGTVGVGVARLVDVFNDFLDKINWSELNRSLKEFWAAIEPYAEQFGEGLIDFFEDVLGIGADLINKIPGFLDGITGALNRGNPETARKWGYALGALATALLAFKGIGAIIGGMAALGNSLISLSTGLGAVFGSTGIFATIGGKIAALFGKGGVISTVFTGITSILGDMGAVVGLGIEGLISSLTGASVTVTVPAAAIAVAIAAVAAALIDLWKTSETFRDSVGLAFSMLKDSICNAFDKIKKAVAPLWEKIKELGSALYELYEATLKPLVEAIASFAAVIAGIIGSKAIDMLSSAISGLCGVLGGAIDIITGVIEVITGLLTLDFSKIQEGFAHISDGLFGLGNGAQEFFTGWMGNFWSNLWSGFGMPIEEAITNVQAWWNDTAVPFFQDIPEWFAGIWDNLKNYCMEKWNQLVDFLGTLPEKIGKIIESIAKWFGELPEKIGYALGYALGKITEWTLNVADYLAEKIPEIIENVKQWFSELPGKIYDGIIKFLDNLKEWATNVKNTFSEKVIEIINSVITFFRELPGKIYDAIKGFFQRIRDWANEAIRTVQSVVPNIISSIVNFFTSLPSKLYDIGKQMIQGLINGVQSMFSSAWNSISNFASGLVSGFKSALNIHSPSRVFFELGEFTIEGYENGLKNIFGDVYSTLDRFSNTMQGHLDIKPRMVMPDIPNYTWNTGEDFIAREKMMQLSLSANTQISSTNEIANNTVSGIKQAVIEGMMEVFMATQGGSDTDDNREIHMHVHIGNDEFGVATFKGLKDASRRGLIPKMV